MYNLDLSKGILELVAVFVNDYLGSKYFIFSYDKASPASDSDILINNEEVFLNILCSFKNCKKENLHIFSLKSFYRKLVFGGRRDSYKRRQMGRELSRMGRV